MTPWDALVRSRTSLERERRILLSVKILGKLHGFYTIHSKPVTTWTSSLKEKCLTADLSPQGSQPSDGTQCCYHPFYIGRHTRFLKVMVHFRHLDYEYPSTLHMRQIHMLCFDGDTHSYLRANTQPVHKASWKEMHLWKSALWIMRTASKWVLAMYTGEI